MMMHKLKALLALARPGTTVTGALSTVMGGYVAGTERWGAIILAAFITALVTAAANAWNDYVDVDIDRVNRPTRPIPSGAVSLQAAHRFALGLNVLAVLLAFLLEMPSFAIVLFSILLLYFYSLRPKSTVLLGNLTVATISAASVIFGGFAAGNVQPTFLPSLIIFVAITAREVLKTMADYEGDLRQQCRTVATVWGKKVSRNIFYVIALGAGVVMSLPYLLDLYQPIYAYLVCFGVYPVLFYILWRVTHDMSPAHLNHLSRLMKLDFVIFFFAVVLGAP
jgi:geranylgeranylglycerol-phosphate geranylgeranyltransferase